MKDAVGDVISDVKNAMSDSLQLTASSSDLAAALQLSMRAVQHENVDVRIHALTSLRDMMHSQQVHTFYYNHLRKDKLLVCNL